MIAALITWSEPHVAALTASNSYLIPVKTTCAVSCGLHLASCGVGKQAWTWRHCIVGPYNLESVCSHSVQTAWSTSFHGLSACFWETYWDAFLKRTRVFQALVIPIPALPSWLAHSFSPSPRESEHARAPSLSCSHGLFPWPIMRILNVALVRLHTFMSACILCMFRAQQRFPNMVTKAASYSGNMRPSNSVWT